MRKAKVRGKDKKQLTLYCMYIQQINKSLCQQIVRLATNRRTAGGKSRSGHWKVNSGWWPNKEAKVCTNAIKARVKEKIRIKKKNKTTTKKACEACKKCLAIRAIYAIEDNKWHRDRTNRLTVWTENEKMEIKRYKCAHKSMTNGFSATPTISALLRCAASTTKTNVVVGQVALSCGVIMSSHPVVAVATRRRGTWQIHRLPHTRVNTYVYTTTYFVHFCCCAHYSSTVTCHCGHLKVQVDMQHGNLATRNMEKLYVHKLMWIG